MYHQRIVAARTRTARPRSAVSTGAGLAGLAGLFAWIGIARATGMDGPYSALTNLAACALPMVVWSLAVDRVHLSPTTGIDWSLARPWREVHDSAITKLVAYWLTWTAIGAIYATFRLYSENPFAFAIEWLERVAPVVVLLSVPYVYWVDRHLIEPRDGAWHLGAWLMGRKDYDREAIYNFLRSWGVKAFFLSFMISVVPQGFANFVNWNADLLRHDPVALANWLITFMFVIDCAFATVGYMMTFRPLDSHIRTANPFAAAWMAALICYPPTTMMGDGRPLDYFPGTRGPDGWAAWFAGHPWLLGGWGAVLVGLTGIYAWATVAFGFRFSNLTNRGILTHGPYAFSRHPAYLSKNSFWWLATLPILTLGSWADAARACALMAVVSGIYYWRAKTEERHLKLDPDYVAYDAWMREHGLIPRLFAKMTRQKLASA